MSNRQNAERMDKMSKNRAIFRHFVELFYTGKRARIFLGTPKQNMLPVGGMTYRVNSASFLCMSLGIMALALSVLDL